MRPSLFQGGLDSVHLGRKWFLLTVCALVEEKGFVYLVPLEKPELAGAVCVPSAAGADGLGLLSAGTGDLGGVLGSARALSSHLAWCIMSYIITSSSVKSLQLW